MTRPMSITPTSTPSISEKKYLDNCEACGRSMMTTAFQSHLSAICPDWNATSLEEIRNILTSSGVHYLFEVSAGYCEYCSALGVSQ